MQILAAVLCPLRSSLLKGDVAYLAEDPAGITGRWGSALVTILRYGRDGVCRFHVPPFRTLIMVTNPELVRCSLTTLLHTFATLRTAVLCVLRGAPAPAVVPRHREPVATPHNLPPQIKEVLTSKDWEIPNRQALQPITGDGLLVTKGDYWKSQRELVCVRRARLCVCVSVCACVCVLVCCFNP